LRALDALERDGGEVDGPWTLAQVLEHCAQSVECSLRGYPRPRGFLVRRLIGPIVLSRFLRRGSMSHDRADPIPRAPPPGDRMLPDALAHLRRALAEFQAHEGPVAEHFAFGRVTRAQYEAFHAMHIADHLSAVRRPGG